MQIDPKTDVSTDEDVEGHMFRGDDPNDPAGGRVLVRGDDPNDEDVEGHRVRGDDPNDEDDVEGHRIR